MNKSPIASGIRLPSCGMVNTSLLLRLLGVIGNYTFWGVPGGQGPRVLLHALHHYELWLKIILADFNLGVLNPDCQTAKFNSPSNLISGYTVI